MMNSMPFLSLILVVRNERANIERCLAGLVAQDYPHDRYEIIVADGASTDNTREICAAFPSCGVPIRVLALESRGRPQGLNAGIRAARGEIVVRVDARAEFAPNYLSLCVRTLQETGADNVGGVQRPVATGNRVQQAVGIALSHPFGVGNAEFRLGRQSGFVDTVYLGCFKREVFDRVGYFDETASVIAEDSEMNQRIRAAGGRVYLNTDIVAYYRPRETLRELWNLYYRYGGARMGAFLKTRKLTSLRQLVAPAFLGCLLLLCLLAFFSTVFFVPLIVLLSVYAAASLAVSIQLAQRHSNPSLAVPLFACFPTMHFAWAAGFYKRLLVPDRPGSYWSN